MWENHRWTSSDEKTLVFGAIKDPRPEVQNSLPKSVDNFESPLLKAGKVHAIQGVQ
jgi:hypothetical protein